MSLIVQVAGGGAPPPSQPQKGGVMTASSHIPASSRPPPAHVTQLTSSPSLGQSPHVVQHHPQPAPHPAAREAHSLSPSYPRPLPLSPHRPHHLAHPRSRAAHISSGRMMINTPMNHLPTPQMPHLPSSPLPLLTPSPAHQLLPTSVNSPSLIPQNIPSGFMPRLPIHVPAPRHNPPPHPRHAPSPRSPLLPLGPQTSSDSNILPPHAFRKLTRPSTSQPDDDIEVGENPPQARRALMSPKHNRRNYFNNLALQDHNYCAAPPPSPPRSPTPPPSPFPNSLAPQPMGVPPTPHDQSVADEPHHNFGLSSYGTSSSSPAPCVGGYPSPHYTGPPLPPAAQTTSPLHRLRQTIEEAGVGPMTPLGESDRDSKAKDRSASDIMEDGGEETETAPEADDDNQDDSVTRCICDYLHDDGYMICCDKCFVWQHVVCMGLDRNNIPDEYLCEKCHPRFVDRNFRKRAKALQRAREKEIFARMHPNNDSSDDEKMPKSGLGGIGHGVGISSKNRKPFSAVTRKLQGKKSLEKKLLENKKVLKKNYKRRGVIKTETTKPQETSPKPESPVKKLSPRKPNIRRKSLSATDGGETEEENTDSLSLRSWIDNYEEAVTNHYSPELRARLQGAKLPTNYFKPKDVNGIRERCNVSLRGNGLKVLTANNFIPQHTPVIECRGKYMLGGGNGAPKGGRNLPFVLVHRLSQEIEVVVDGKTYGNDSRFCRRADGRSGESNAVVKHHLEKGSLHLYIVATKNIDKNQEILLPPLEQKNGVLDGEMSIQEEIREIRKVSGERKLVNGTMEGRRRGVSSTSVKRRIKRENVKKKEMAGSSSDEDENERVARDIRVKEERERLAAQREERERERKEERPPSPRKTRFGGDRGVVSSGGVDTSSDRESVDQILEQVVGVKEEVEDLEDEQTEKILETVIVKEEKILEPVIVKEEKVEEEQEPEKEKEEEVMKEEKVEKPPLSIIIPKEEKDSLGESGPLSPPPSMTSPASLQKSPGKASLGLPDTAGLIVGVNTINYDVSIRNKAKTREEKKMEMIMKAIEAMERAEARKRSEGGDSSSDKPEKKRRRSNSVKTSGNSGAVDSALDQSSADEGCAGVGQASRVKGRGRGRRQTGGLGGRRRSRAKSGDSSALSEAETPEDMSSLAVPLNINSNLNLNLNCDKTEQFKFPRHKKAVVESEADDDVSKQYLRGSRSPPGIANHLLRSAKTDKSSHGQDKKQEERTQTSDKSIGCSAKKRWLRAAMSEDTSEENSTVGSIVAENLIGSASPAQASPEPDYTDYTPLKKRRLATYNETEEQMRVEVGDSNLQSSISNLNLSSPVNEKLKSLPNGLKKRLISNLVLEAVLDRAMEDYSSDKRTSPIDGQASIDRNREGKAPSEKGTEGQTGSEEICETEQINTKAIENHTAVKAEEISEKITGDKPKSYKDRKKEAIIKAESGIKQSEAIIRAESAIKQSEAEHQNSSETVDVKVNCDPPCDSDETVTRQEAAVLSETDHCRSITDLEPLTDHKRTETGPELSPVPVLDPVTSPAQESPQLDESPSVSIPAKVPDNEDNGDVPVEEEEFCSTPLQDEEMTEALTSPSDDRNISPKSPSPIKEPLLEKVSPLQMLEAVSPMDTSTVSSCPTPGTPVFDEPDVASVDAAAAAIPAAAASLPVAVSCPPVPRQHKVFKSFFSTDLSVEDIDRQLEARRELLVREAREESAREERGSSVMTTAPVTTTEGVPASMGRLESSCHSPSSEDSRPGSAGSSETLQQQLASQQQAKKRVSLADYKKRKQQGGGREGRNSESSTPTFSQSLSLPGTLPGSLPLTTPTLSLPSLPDLPGLESYSGRSGGGREERSSRGDRRQEKGRSRVDSLGSRHTTPSPVSSLPPPRLPLGAPPSQLPAHVPPPLPLPTPDHPREDLTERLRKEFGLNIDESDGEGSGGEGRLGEETNREAKEGEDKRETRETPSEERERLEKFRDKSSDVKNYSDKSRDGYSDKSRDGYGGKCRDGYSDKSRDSYSDKAGYRDSREREGYRDSKSRDSYSDKNNRDTEVRGSKRGLPNHGGARRPPHPSSPTNCAPGRGLPNQGGARRPPHHPSSPTRRNSQDSAYSHPTSYYKNESSRRNQFSRNFYTS
eukprot:GFUD01041722.1.p1 GENE.GFUD01041722.1~~GFUD01041722.1.p1  ORF type:complete len:2117 (-),score=667.90 GFUD01041722.1:649-6999(-)